MGNEMTPAGLAPVRWELPHPEANKASAKQLVLSRGIVNTARRASRDRPKRCGAPRSCA